ncbi:hypothetical protein N825_23280 [Skermanella stibiiresistens SB22]|uniref:HNH nuclease domain-containing protein n=1 Tax=Skermanella stibiiresistens SB22 TaxID=1385369 RepID=W9GW54_9PROT|nr:NUMOD4 domain-containing protein [Skermanella stibiiresistens]EWY36886.1 hypothetical protein N825_23280 [Skermanella stibiiresistens SB22]
MIDQPHPTNDQLHSDACTETWRDIPGYPYYQASDMGRIRRSKPGRGGTYVGRVLRPRLDRDGYARCVLSHDGVQEDIAVAKLVMLAFVGPRHKPWYEIHHANSTRHDNRLSNLSYVTRVQNMTFAYQRRLERAKAGLTAYGRCSPAPSSQATPAPTSARRKAKQALRREDTKARNLELKPWAPRKRLTRWL